MNDEGDGRGRGGIDWKVLVAALALFWTVVVGAGGLFRQHILATVAEQIWDYSTSAEAKQLEFFRHVESEADGAVGRITIMEQHCATVRDWRVGVDASITGLRDWRDRCSQKAERIQALIETQAEGLRAAQAKIERMEEKLEGKIDRVTGGTSRK